MKNISDFLKEYNLKIIDSQEGYTTSYHHKWGDDLDPELEDEGVEYCQESKLENKYKEAIWVSDDMLLEHNQESLVNSYPTFFKK